MREEVQGRPTCRSEIITAVAAIGLRPRPAPSEHYLSRPACRIRTHFSRPSLGSTPEHIRNVRLDIQRLVPILTHYLGVRGYDKGVFMICILAPPIQVEPADRALQRPGSGYPPGFRCDRIGMQQAA